MSGKYCVQGWGVATQVALSSSISHGFLGSIPSSVCVMCSSAHSESLALEK